MSDIYTQGEYYKKSNSPKVVIIGGGTGVSVLLRGIKEYTEEITAIITVADDGGGSGVLREDLGMLPPGDIRSCILALADDESIMQNLLNYRFEEGRLRGQSFGNLFIAAMNAISDNFVEAIKNVSDVMAVKGTVLPVTTEDITLTAELVNGQIVNGESYIAKSVQEMKSNIKKMRINPCTVKALPYCLDAIEQADIIILGPGSLYTSIIPNLLVENIEIALHNSKGKKFYISNVMTQPGETQGYDLFDHIEAIENHLANGSKVVDYIIANSGIVERKYLKQYQLEGSDMVRINLSKFREGYYKFILDDFVEVKNGYIRHNAKKIIETILNVKED
ncbi:uridine diphosphate-N-acetylglucosamine-binding protein YvcK [Alkalibaculum sp. M08DMB]|uniref:Putative gluconeogenesis factor n=1 Tax=Alkalibaculum sporogenes TaxID=2655001 RepID=A0A6A7KA26_9FIRM|nr:gluconeogenesis factor YvcK family protein [Alkalibaculum sporogenes]MPW26358.1 uridine diphosphate-N-acetylglucosamine-binding protein YvcK [Alkalibaculum sporogenes]